MIFFEAPHRLDATLAAMAEAFGDDRPAAVCRELTKTYEEVRRGGLRELAEWAAEGVRGEITIVVGGAAEVAVDPASALRAVQERVEAGERLKDVTADVAAATGLSRKDAVQRRARCPEGVRPPRRPPPAQEPGRTGAARPPRIHPMSKVLSAVAWPYANGPRHIGHVAGFGVPSDVFSRYMRMAGHDVLMVSGTDEHGTPILVRRRQGRRQRHASWPTPTTG